MASSSSRDSRSAAATKHCKLEEAAATEHCTLEDVTEDQAADDSAYHMVPIYCQDCQMWLNGRTQWLDHYLLGKKHRKKITGLALASDDPDDHIHVRVGIWQEEAENVYHNMEFITDAVNRRQH